MSKKVSAGADLDALEEAVGWMTLRLQPVEQAQILEAFAELRAARAVVEAAEAAIYWAADPSSMDDLRRAITVYDRLTGSSS